MGDMRGDTTTPSLVELAQKVFENILPAFTRAEVDVLIANSRFEEALANSNEQGRQASVPDASGAVERDDSLVDRRLVEWLATDSQAAACIRRSGLRIHGAVIAGDIDLLFAGIPFPIDLVECEVQGALVLTQARTRGLRLDNCKIEGLKADGCVIDGDLQLTNGFQTKRAVLLRNASIAGDMNCAGASFMSQERFALLADGLRVKGDLGLCGAFRATGEIRFIGATVGGDLVCSTATLHNPGGIAFMADRSIIGGAAIFTEDFKASGEVRLMGARVARDLIFEKASLSNPNAKALNAEHIDVGGSFRLRNGFHAEGEVSLLRSVISKSFDCSGGLFRKNDADESATAANGIAISADGIVAHDIYLALGFEAHGLVKLMGARISGDLACVDGAFNNPGRIALAADGALIDGSVFLRKAKIRGEVRLVGAKIGSSLECDAASIKNPQGMALNGQGAQIGGNALFRSGFRAEGIVSLHKASVRRYLLWQEIRNPSEASLDLREASVSIFGDAAASWPGEGKLRLRGFKYEELSGDAPLSARERVKWVKLQPRSERQPQTYEMLARSLRESGDYHGADKLLIEKNNEILKSDGLRWFSKAGFCFRRIFNGYGYRPSRVFLWALLLLAVSSLLFAAAWHKGFYVLNVEHSGASIALDTHRLADPNFRPVMYAVDSFIPFVDLGQIESWTVDLNASGNLLGRIRTTGTFVNDFRLALSMIGWFLVAYFASRVVGAIARRL